MHPAEGRCAGGGHGVANGPSEPAAAGTSAERPALGEVGADNRRLQRRNDGPANCYW